MSEGHMQKSEEKQSRTDGLVLGVVLVAVGTAVLLSRADLFPFELGTLWPLVIVVFGLGNLIAGRPGKGALEILIGTSIFASVQGYIAFGDLWPMLLILTGAGVALGAFHRPCRKSSTEDPSRSPAAEEI